MTPQQAQEAVRVAFQRVFGTTNRSIEQRIVWAWLVHTCRRDLTTFDVDPRMNALLEGRREVFLGIQKRLIEGEPTINEILNVTNGDDSE